MHPIADRRITRMAFGTAIALFVSQAVAWPVSFLMPILVAVILGLPLPRLNAKQTIGFIIALAVPLWGCLLLLPLLKYQPLVGFALLFFAIFGSFLFSANGGSKAFGAFLTMGLAVVTAIGSDSVALAVIVAQATTVNAIIALLFVHLAHILFPDHPFEGKMPMPPAPEKPDRAEALRSAWRSTAIVLPVVIFFLLIEGSSAYLVVMIKVATMGQQAENDRTRNVARSLLASTIIGGIGAVIIWELMKIWPSIIPYTLLIALGGLIMGQRMFKGLGPHPAIETWSYAYITMILLIAPAVTDGLTSSAAGAAFFDRFMIIVFATIYGVAAVSLFDALWRSKLPPTVVE